ncbi:MAG: sugar ABC transporter permease [Anaerolineae bacterium]|nr:sugar ABC transporter permease [Anaerolineae bacterium]
MTTQSVPKTSPQVRPSVAKPARLARFLAGPWPWMLPALFMLMLFRLYPILSQFYYAMTDMRVQNLQEFNFVGLDNYRFLLEDQFFIDTLLFTFFFTFAGVLLQWVIGFGLALLMDQPLQGRTFFRLGIMASWVISSLIVGYTWRLMLHEGNAGVLSAWLMELGYEDPVRWLSAPDNAQYSVIAVNVWRSTAYTMVFMLAGLQTIPRDLLEAATVDGANLWQRLVKIKIPYMRQLIAINVVFITIATFNVYEQILVLTRGGPGRATETVSLKMYETAFGSLSSGSLGLIGRGAAMGNIMFLFTLVFALAYLWLTLYRKGDEA